MFLAAAKCAARSRLGGLAKNRSPVRPSKTTLEKSALGWAFAGRAKLSYASKAILRNCACVPAHTNTKRTNKTVRRPTMPMAISRPTFRKAHGAHSGTRAETDAVVSAPKKTAASSFDRCAMLADAFSIESAPADKPPMIRLAKSP